MNGADDEVCVSDTHLILTVRRGVWCRWTCEAGGDSVPKENKESRRLTHATGAVLRATNLPARRQQSADAWVGGQKSKREQEPGRR